MANLDVVVAERRDALLVDVPINLHGIHAIQQAERRLVPHELLVACAATREATPEMMRGKGARTHADDDVMMT